MVTQTAVKETGIIMSGSHPQDILEGRKAMTRRTWGLEWINLDPDAFKFVRMDGDLAVFEQVGFSMVEVEPTVPRYSFPKKSVDEGGSVRFWVKCPYGALGDRLWVRETWVKKFSFWMDVPESIAYKADGNYPEFAKWRPSIHMPRWVSRILLEITDVRVERLQGISEEDIKAEGYTPFLNIDGEGVERELSSGLEWYINLWDSLNGKKYPWASNPWVWCISFRRVQ